MTSKIFSQVYLILGTLVLLFLFQNCDSASRFSILINNKVGTLENASGNGVAYDGKIAKYDFFLGVTGETPSLHLAGAQPPYTLDRGLPNGLIFDPQRGIIYGTPLEVTGGYWAYAISATSANNGVPLILQFLLGVGAVYQVDSPMDETLIADLNFEDGLCKTLHDNCSLRAAIEQSNYNTVKSRILLPAGHFNLATYPLVINKRMDIWGIGPDKTIFDGENQIQVMNVNTDDFEIKNIHVTSGSLFYAWPNGGVITKAWSENPKANGACLRLNDNTMGSNISENVAKLVGFRVLSSEFSNCYLDTAMQGGAAIHVSGNKLTIENSSFHNNTNVSGGGYDIGGGAINVISLTQPTIVKSSIFMDNSTVWDGAAIKFNNGSIDISQSTFINNIANDKGGALSFNNSYFAKISNSVFKNNQATNLAWGVGGGISWDCLPWYNLHVEDTLFDGNKSAKRGSAIAMYDNYNGNGLQGDIKIYRSQFRNNISNSSEGALHIGPSNKVNIQASEFRNNTGGNCFKNIVTFSSGVISKGSIQSLSGNTADVNDCGF